MPFYKTIDAGSAEGRRIIEGIQRLRTLQLPVKTLDKTLLLASWNIREFGGRRYGGREDEALFYIAEITSRFDIVAVQEVRDNLDELERLVMLLGPWWKFLVSDITLGAAGNNERHAFIYDTRKLQFGGLAGELVPAAHKKADGTLASDFAFARTPYLAGFQAGWFKFTICTQHAYYGDSRADDPQRVADAESVARLLGLRRKSADRWANNAILLGDFNVFTTRDKTFKALEKATFETPAALDDTYTNAKLDRPFDQIAFLAPDVQRQVTELKAGVVPFFDFVYRAKDWRTYKAKSEKAFLAWRSYKMSDHLPVWVEINVDFGDDYLARRLASGVGPGRSVES